MGDCVEGQEVQMFEPVYVRMGHATVAGHIYGLEAGRLLNKNRKHYSVLVTLDGIASEVVMPETDIYRRTDQVAVSYGTFLSLVD